MRSYDEIDQRYATTISTAMLAMLEHANAWPSCWKHITAAEQFKDLLGSDIDDGFSLAAIVKITSREPKKMELFP